MKKVLPTLIVLIIIAVLIVLGIVFVEMGNINNSQPIVNEKNCEIRLDANATTGFSWSYTIDKEGILKEAKEEYISDNSDGRAGVGGTQYYEFEGINEGTAVITLTYSQPWDKETAPAKTVIYSLDVDSNLKVTATKVENTPIADNQYEIILKSNASTGFAWSYTMNKEGIIKEISSEYINPEDMNLDGAPGKQRFVFEGLKAGTVTLNFVYTRSWEKNVEPAETKEIVLVVDNNLKVTEIIGID